MKRKHEEDDLQMTSARLFKAILQSHVIALHVPNGGRRNIREAGRLKAMGVLAGAPDWMIMWRFFQVAESMIKNSYVPLGAFPKTLHLEMKSKTGRQSPEQKSFEQRCKAIGHYYALCRSIDDVLAALEIYEVPHKRISLQPLIAVTVTAL